MRHGKKDGLMRHLTLRDEYVIPFNQQFKNTTVGGLSGIDYNPGKDEYYLVSDDRSEINPARFYTIKISLNRDKIDSIIFLKTTPLKSQLGIFYPNLRQDAGNTPDPEALRFNPNNNTFLWTSEGERILNPQKNILLNPSVTEINTTGNYIDTFQLPPQLFMNATETGPLRNGVFEGLTFANNYKTLYVSVEEPLYNDGPRAGTKDSTGIARILKFDMRSKKPVAQYAYKIDAVAHAPMPAGAFKVNGISDILWLGNNQMLMIERSFSSGRLGCTIKVFIADFSKAENISNIESLKNKPDVKYVSKRLLLNMDTLGMYIDNIEGVTFGPRMPNGNQTLIFVADNNFNALEKTQILLFEVSK